MLTNIERIEAGTGLIGTLIMDGRRPLSVAVLLSAPGGPNEDGARNQALSAQVNAHWRRHAGTGRGSRRQAFEQPALLRPAAIAAPSGATALDEQIMEALGNRATSRLIVHCDDPATYAYVSERLGVSRADHIALAEMSRLGVETAHKKRPVPSGKVHQLLEDMASTRALHKKDRRFELFCGDTDEAHINMIRLSQHIEARIPHAVKINLGDISQKTHMAGFEDASSPVFRNFRLPYRECLFEFDDLADWKGQQYKTRSFIFAETLDLDDGQTIYQAYIIQYHPSPGARMAQMYDYGLSWQYDSDGNCETSAFLTYGKDPYTSEQLAVRNCVNMQDIVFSICGAINRPTTKMIEVPASQKRRVEIGGKPKQPFFDFYVFEESALPAGTLMEQAPIRRGPLSGERKSPRAHDRSGYEKTYRSPRWGILQGTTVWINPTKVGKPKDGVKAKGFKVEEP